jgi:hypothetical protein
VRQVAHLLLVALLSLSPWELTMFTITMVFVLGCLCAAGAYGLVVLARRPLRGAARPAWMGPAVVREASMLVTGMQGRQATQLWADGKVRGLTVGLVALAHGTYGLEVAGSVYGKAPQAREALDRATSERLWG